jgi:hypothetical protein
MKNVDIYFMTIWNILGPIGKFYGLLVCLDQEKSGNPGHPDSAGMPDWLWNPLSSRTVLLASRNLELHSNFTLNLRYSSQLATDSLPGPTFENNLQE